MKTVSNRELLKNWSNYIKGTPILLTFNVSDTLSNCFDTVATASAIFCFVTNITSENDKPYIMKDINSTSEM